VTLIPAVAPGERPESSPAPFGRRRCEVVANERAGLYRLIEADDTGGPPPMPGQFYMLAAERNWGGEDGRPHLARAFSVCRVRGLPAGLRLGFLVDAIGPGTARLAALEPGEGLLIVGPLGSGFTWPGPGTRSILVAGGIGLAPLVILAEFLRESRSTVRVLAGFRSAAHAEAATLAGSDVAIATDDGSVGHAGLVTELLAEEVGANLDKTRVYACGPPLMLEAVRRLCVERGVHADLALEEAMACGFGACFGCVVRTRDGYRRICVDGPVIPAADLDEGWLAH